MILRTVQCCVCGRQQTESQPNEGWLGWSGVIGVAIDGDENPHLCPEHTAMVAGYIDRLKQVEEN